MDDLVGKTLGQYEIRKLIGKGGMSSVYLAYQPSMDRQVAIKLLPPEFLHDDTFLTRFQQECRVVARLEHLHILPVYDVGEENGIPYIVMRYLQGGTLSDEIAKGPMDPKDAARFITQIGDALDFAHSAGVIHRDMKPSNILLDENRNAFLADFGIARLAAQHASLTGSRIIGTPPYIAPEMVHKGQEVTYLSDIYALGIIAYEMVTGQPPYVDPDPMKVLMMHVMEPVPTPRDQNPMLGIAVDSVIRRCLAKTADERYQTASGFARAFTEAASMESETMPVPTEESKGPDLGEVNTIRTPSPAFGMDIALSETGEHEQPTSVQSKTTGRRERKRQEREAKAADKAAEKAKSADSEKKGCRMRWLVIVLAIIGGLTVTLILLGRLGDIFEAIEARQTPEALSSPTPVIIAGETPGGGGGVGDLVLSRQQLAFASNRDGDYEIYLIQADGEGLEQLTDNTAYDFDPDWSPEGSQITYASDEAGNSEIMIMNNDGTNAVNVTNNPAKDADPDWSPDGNWIAFASNRDGDFEIFVVRPDGSDLMQLTFNDRNDYSPSWSSDSERLIYYVQEGEDERTSEVYMLDVDSGEAPRRMTSNTWLDKWPTFATNSDLVAFTSGAGLPPGRRAIFIARDETDHIQVTTGDSKDDDPSWAPFGRWLAFDSDRDGDSYFDIFIINIDTSEIIQITDEMANDVAPAWRPRQQNGD